MRLSNRQFNLLGATALMAVATHLSRLPLWLSAFLLLVAPWRMWSRARSDKAISAWFRVPMVFALVAAIVVHYGNLFGREPGSALACGLLMLKLLESEKIRDARAAIGFAAFVLMSALLFTQTMAFTLALCISLIPLLAALMALQPAPISTGNRLIVELRSGAMLLGLGLPLAIAAFLFVPRLSSPMWGSPGGLADSRTGLSDSMSPGSMTDLLIDDSPAMRVHFDGAVPPNAERYFRALVLWDFDGTTWNRVEQRPQQSSEVVESTGDELSYEVTLEPTSRPWLAALDVPLDTPERSRMSNDRTLYARNSIDQLRQYRVRSALDYRLAASIAPRDRRRALRLPDGFNPKTTSLALKWRAEGKDDSAVVKSALDLFNASFTYTLSPPLLGRDSVDDFLFDTQAGFCEHYSAAFVVLMRSAGIPARVVTGYQGGWWNALGEYLLVRQSDAHAWSEVWLQGRGWVRVDPTASVNPVRVEAGAAAANSGSAWSVGSWWLGMRNQLDVINRMWTQTIVQFSALRQKNLLTSFGISRAEQRDLLLVLIGVVGTVLVLATFWVLRTGEIRKGDTLDAAWRMLRRRMARSGLPMHGESEGPLDYLKRIRLSIRDGPARRQLDELIRHYVELRYARREPVEADVQDLTRKIREFRPPPAVHDTRIPAG
jgi:protein-glutamine gamma-glutamyltransferase